MRCHGREVSRSRPRGNTREARKYFCERPRLYGFSADFCVRLNGINVFSSLHNPGAVSHINSICYMRELYVERFQDKE